MTDCYFEKKDWRLCKDEVQHTLLIEFPIQLNHLGRGVTDHIIALQMETFRRCWKAHGNDVRTSSKDADKNAK